MSNPATNNLPTHPAQGQQFWLQTGSHYCLGIGYSVGKVNSRSFYIRSEGTVTRYRLFEWAGWLQQRMNEGLLCLAGRRLFSPIHPLPTSAPIRPVSSVRTGGPASSKGSTTNSSPGPKATPTSKESSMSQPAIEISLRARDQRFLRGARDVLKNYQLSRRRPRKGTPGLAQIEVSKGTRAYVVEFQLDWSAPPHCSCPDSTQGGPNRAGGFCKHTIASALKWDDLRCQLLDLLL
jgi:hypothetical protein